MHRKALVIAMVLVAAACGDAGDGADPPADATSVATSAAATTTTAPISSACPAAPFSGTIERTAESETGNGTHVVTSRSDGEIISAYAYSFGDGATYTVYAGDHQIDRDGVGSATLTAPPGGMLATIFIQATEELVAGSVVDLSFVPIVDTGGGAEIGGFGADDVTGGLTITGLDDDRICFQIDTSDPQQELHGTISAEIVG